MGSRERAHLEQIFRAGLAHVEPRRMILERVRLEGSRLRIALEQDFHELDLDRFRRVVLLGAGKAVAPMAQAMEELLGERIDNGLAVTKQGHGLPLTRTTLMEAGHPVPDLAGVDAARRMLELAQECDAETLVVMLISGGGSALLPLPASSANGIALSLEDKQAATRALLACGASIQEINIVRKHLSGIKGGQLLRALAPATCLNLILSDVIGDDLGSIASGPTVADSSTFAQALEIIERHDITKAMPASVLEHVRQGQAGALPETLKPGDRAEAQATTILLGSNAQALVAAGAEAARLGYLPRTLSAPLLGEAREEAARLAGLARGIRRAGVMLSGSVCMLSGGEPVVTLRGPGVGGRNQEMALAFLAELARTPEDLDGVSFLAGATDGTDGPTEAAGAFADADCLEASRSTGQSIATALRSNDSHPFFAASGGLLKTGPTHTNVCDLHLTLIRPEG